MENPLQTFNRLTVVERAGRDKHGNVLYLCRCSCGNLANVRRSHLKSGHTKSCGCLQDETMATSSITHGHSLNGRRSPTYHSWQSMLQRCTNPNALKYDNYGGAGVIVCDRWLSFENFLTDMGETRGHNPVTVPRCWKL